MFKLLNNELSAILTIFGLSIAAIVASSFSLFLAMLLLAFAIACGILSILILFKRKSKLLPILFLCLVFSLLLFVGGVKAYYRYALENAIEAGNVEKVESLVSKDHDVNADSRGGQNMLTLSFRYGLQKISPFKDERMINRMTPQEVEDRIYTLLEILIDNGANVNSLDPHGWAPLHLATPRNQNRIVKMLIEKGADVNFKNRWGNTPLHMAAGHPSNSEMIEMLIENGADVNARDAQGNTPLHDSIFSGNPKIVEILLEKGADPTIKNYAGQTALELAKKEKPKAEDVIATLEKSK